MGSLGKLHKKTKLPVYITEYGVQNWGPGTSPAPVTAQHQVKAIRKSVRQVHKQPFVKSYAQYLLADDPTWKTGLQNPQSFRRAVKKLQRR